MTTEHEAKIEMIRKLMAKANGTTNANEASIFMNKALQMMADYGLDMEKVDMASIKEARVKSKFSVSKVKSYELTLMHSIAEAFGCKLMWQGNRSWLRHLDGNNYANFIFVGPKDRLNLATYAAGVLGPQLYKARQSFAQQCSEVLWSTGDFNKNYEEDKAAVRKAIKVKADSFAQGWSWEVSKKVTKFALNDKERILIESYIKQNAGEEEAKTSKNNIDYRAAMMGAEEGRKANLHRPIEGGVGETHLLGETKQIAHQ